MESKVISQGLGRDSKLPSGSQKKINYITWCRISISNATLWYHSRAFPEEYRAWWKWLWLWFPFSRGEKQAYRGLSKAPKELISSDTRDSPGLYGHWTNYLMLWHTQSPEWTVVRFGTDKIILYDFTQSTFPRPEVIGSSCLSGPDASGHMGRSREPSDVCVRMHLCAHVWDGKWSEGDTDTYRHSWALVQNYSPKCWRVGLSQSTNAFWKRERIFKGKPSLILFLHSQGQKSGISGRG